MFTYCLDGFHLNTAATTVAFGSSVSYNRYTRRRLCPVGVGGQCRVWCPVHVNAYIVSTSTHIPVDTKPESSCNFHWHDLSRREREQA